MLPRCLRSPVLPVLAMAILACTPSPEERVRSRLAEGVEAVRNGDARAIADTVSASYRDDRGLDKAGVLSALALFTRGRRLHVMHRVEEIAFPRPAVAEVRLVVALVARPVKDFAALRDVEADAYRLRLVLADEDGMWRVAAASQESVVPGDLF